MQARMLSAASAALPISDVFSTYPYTGNGSTQTITNGIDLAGKGGLIWTKSRALTGNNWFVDTARGINFGLYSNAANAQFSDPGTFTSFNSTGYSMNNSYGDLNSGQPGRTYVSWTFREAPKFFDVVTYTGDATSNRVINHSLGIAPGMIIVKNITTAGTSWFTYHRSLAANNVLFLNTTSASSDRTSFGDYFKNVTDTSFTLNEATGEINGSGSNFVAYLFAHDATANGLIQCGSFTTDGSGNGTFDPGWPQGVQFVMLKAASTSGDWEVYDTQRTPAWSSSDARLRPNLTDAEDSVTRLSASGTALNFTNLLASQTYICMVVAAP